MALEFINKKPWRHFILVKMDYPTITGEPWDGILFLSKRILPAVLFSLSTHSVISDIQGQ